jgi:branched-subunit amino acid aminotransferase/4-amino-4-deoxychorismate lyase
MTSAAIAWIASGDGPGHWGDPRTLGIPLNDRSLLLADGLFETVLLHDGQPQLLAEHLERWQRSAILLGMAPPPGLEAVTNLAAEAVTRSGITSGALRLNWSRGGGGRGIELPDPQEAETGGRFWLQLSPLTPHFSPISVIVSPSERRCATSLLSRCKTFAYGPAIQARRQARAAGVDDALLESTAGGLCCGTTANLLLQLEDGPWLTPALASGCLPGVMRRRALELGLVQETHTPLGMEALAQGTATAAWLINSLGCRPIHTLHGQPLSTSDPKEAGRFWRRLLATP